MTDDFTRFINENCAKTYNLVYRMLGNVEESEDVTQEAFLQACKSLPGFKGNSMLSTWFYRIVMNVVRDHIRARQRRSGIESGQSVHEGSVPDTPRGTTGNTEDVFFRNQRLRDIYAKVLDLPEQYRSVFVLNVIEGFDHKEIGRILGISAGTARIRLFRAVTILRSQTAASGINEVDET